MTGAAPLRIVAVNRSGTGSLWFPEVCAALSRRGHRVIAIVASRPADLAERVAAAGVECVRVDLGQRRPLSARTRRPFLDYPAYALNLGRGIGRLAGELRRLHADVVISYQFPTVVLGRLAARLAGGRVHIAVPSSPYSLEAPLTRLVERASARLDAGVVAGSEYIRDLYEGLGVPRDRIDVVYFGVDESRFDPSRARPDRARALLGVSPDVRLVGQVAHFYAPIGGWVAPAATRGRGVKGHETLLEAASIVLADRPETRFVLAGGAYGAPAETYQAQIEERARELGVSGAILFPGRMGNVPDLLASLDVAVQASRSENLGGTIESLLMAVPTVATRVGGMPEAVLHERTGLLVEPDRPGELAQAIMRLLDDRALARRLAVAGRAHALEHLTFERSIDRLDRSVRARWSAARGASGAGRG